MDRGKRIYLSITYTVVAVISIYVGTTQWIIHEKLYKDYNLSIFTGKPVLEVDSDSLVMMFNIDVRTVDFRFTHKLDGVIEINKDTRDKEAVTIETIIPFKTALSNDRNWVKLKVADGETIEDKLIKVEIKSVVDGMPRTLYFIDEVRVNGEKIEVYDFLGNYIDHHRRNLILHIPRSFSNISKNIANNYGNKMLEVIKFVLIVLLTTQTVLYLIAFVWQPQEISDYFNNANPDEGISIVDSISRKYAIPLGFLGSVLSIWTSLEINQQQFSDFNSVLEIFKGGIFTTVLGLITNIVCLLRGNRIKLIKGLKVPKSEE